MKYAVQMGPGAMVYITIHKDWFRRSKVNSWGRHRYADSMAIA
jgi:hypothetical protein